MSGALNRPIASSRAAPPVAWRLEWRDYAGHKLGRSPPPCQRRQFNHREAALAELGRLRAGRRRRDCRRRCEPVLPKRAAVQGRRRPAPMTP
jgi:hypothetical protein